MRHSKFGEVHTLVDAGFAVLLTGEKGSGKTTLAKQVAEELKLTFYSMSMTRQTTLSHLLGFMSVNGTYIPSVLYDAIENGGVFLLDEMDASDANVLLSLNTIENGYVSFPTGIMDCHEDFRLMATANPQDQHDFYTGRSKLDAATLDRFDVIDVERDNNLEKTLVDYHTFLHMELLREVLEANNSSTIVSMRDSMRYQVRKDLDLLEGVIFKLAGKSDLVFETYEERVKLLPKHADQSECKTLAELVDLVSLQAGKEPHGADFDVHVDWAAPDGEQTASGKWREIPPEDRPTSEADFKKQYEQEHKVIPEEWDQPKADYVKAAQQSQDYARKAAENAEYSNRVTATQRAEEQRRRAKASKNEAKARAHDGVPPLPMPAMPDDIPSDGSD
jgi:DNA polymerase III gamma/tau subunit